MQPAVSRSSLEELEEPPDVFCKLGSLIVEGRVPRANELNCIYLHSSSIDAGHKQDTSNGSYVYEKDDNFRRHMLLLWQNNIPVSIEVLLSPDCRMVRQKARSVEFSTIPEPGSILLEQWTVAVHNFRSPENLITSRGLFQAVRSYLHFSQLSAWLASTHGKKPKNVLFRITIPGEAFATKFSCPPEHHFFPPAGVNRSSTVNVSVRSLPRSDEIPRAMCGHHQSQSSNSEEDEERKLAMAGALAWKEVNTSSDTDLRRALVRTKLSECRATPRPDSMDSTLGDSLLDPPQCLQKIPPKRYQSPSRCGSPSLEMPEHLLFKSKHRVHGLHPRLLHAGGEVPRLSLPSNSIDLKIQETHGTCRADDNSRKLIHDSEQLHSKVFCKRIGPLDGEYDQYGIKEESHDKYHTCPPPGLINREGWTHEYCLKPDSRAGSVSLEESGIESDADLTCDSETNISTCCLRSPRRLSLTEDVSLLHLKAKKRPSLDDLFDDGSDRPTPAMAPLTVTQVFRAETLTHDPDLDKGNQLLNSIIRTSERNGRLLEKEKARGTEEHISIEEKIDPQFTEINFDVSFVQSNQGIYESRKRVKSVISSTPNKEYGSEFIVLSDDNVSHPKYQLEPLDLSFDSEGHIWSDCDSNLICSPSDETRMIKHEEKEQQDIAKKESISAIPNSVDQERFRKSFNSAASMVFHRRTGLPLTSSPAPLRKGNEKFDFDSTITSPHDIKRVLYRAESQKFRTDVQRRRRRSSRQGLSASAPASVPSSNLLGSFEESVLNGRLEPVSTVAGFSAEIGASGTFHPKHRTVPVTVFFYTLDDNSTISSPYLGHINLGKKGYRVPEKGTIQVTLFNPLGTVVKMFVVIYNLFDMPPNSQTFLRQRTFYMPCDVTSAEDGKSQKWLRYLIHLRFASSKSGKIYLHTDMRMIIFRKSDLDAAADHSPGKGFELRSFTRGPNNPKFSPRK